MPAPLHDIVALLPPPFLSTRRADEDQAAPHRAVRAKELPGTLRQRKFPGWRAKGLTGLTNRDESLRASQTGGRRQKQKRNMRLCRASAQPDETKSFNRFCHAYLRMRDL
ncbi:hypothetical protein NITMOv2_4034 [Nitrospira moscoviensis]|uniref:Uncharacterized protein n=1 Tax=Nitrospira moscoviensis TaxID=42253 RepID=A0A0K2GHJ1_NITMO|nr:hypothetical protein NITMOv2_4034 [Nitrospira moscoviensis]